MCFCYISNVEFIHLNFEKKQVNLMKKGAYFNGFVLKNDILHYHLSYEKIDVCHSCNRG